MTKHDEPEEGPDVEVYIAGMVQATVAKTQTNQPALASNSKSTKKVTLQSILKQAKNSSARQGPAVCPLSTSRRENMLQLDKGWDPGRTTRIYEVYNEEDKIFNDAICNKLVAALDDSEMNTDEESRTELDSHANMAVIGRHAYILAETGKMVEVNPFTPTCRILGLPHLIPLLQCVNRLGFEVCSVNNCQTEQGSLITLI